MQAVARRIARSEVPDALAWLGWWEGCQYHGTQARLVSVRLDSVSLVAPDSPNAGQVVDLSLEGADAHRAADAEGTVLAVTSLGHGQTLVRLGLRGRRLATFLKTATHLLDVTEPVPAVS
jgi:hypothetical protein